jgi:hypothetical protein
MFAGNSKPRFRKCFRGLIYVGAPWGGVREVEITATLINGVKAEYPIIDTKTGETTFRATSGDSRTFVEA